MRTGTGGDFLGGPIDSRRPESRNALLEDVSGFVFATNSRQTKKTKEHTMTRLNPFFIAAMVSFLACSSAPEKGPDPAPGVSTSALSSGCAECAEGQTCILFGLCYADPPCCDCAQCGP